MRPPNNPEQDRDYLADLDIQDWKEQKHQFDQMELFEGFDD